MGDTPDHRPLTLQQAPNSESTTQGFIIIFENRNRIDHAGQTRLASRNTSSRQALTS
jgi:hypothetical protein